MASKGKERENFFRINVLVVDHIKNALVDMLIYYLYVCQNDMSFEKFINEHKEDIKYLKSKRILYQEEVDKLIVDNKAISGITVDALEVTLLRRLLDNLCPELFMDDGSKTLQDFLKKNHHDIYHLFKCNQRCCQCTDHYQFPVTEELLTENQYKNMFESSPCVSCTGTTGAVCSDLPCKDTAYIQLDYGTRRNVLEHFSRIFKTMQKLKKLREKAYGHIDAGVIANAIYDDYKKEIEENIIVLARICGNEAETRLALDVVQKRSCDETVCIQYMNSLSEQVKRDKELMEVIGENRQILQENNQILQKIPQQIQELTEEVRNLKTTETNLTKDNQAGLMMTCSPESSSNNISPGNDQRGQGYQSSNDTDAEPNISSVNNDLENKTDMFDGVVLHADEDRSAAI